jgi:glutamate 5-kinase
MAASQSIWSTAGNHTAVSAVSYMVMEGFDTIIAQRSREIRALRAIAQQHLQEIGQQEEQEQREEKEVQAVLAADNRRRTKKNERGRILSEIGMEGAEKSSKLRSAEGKCSTTHWHKLHD